MTELARRRALALLLALAPETSSASSDVSAPFDVGAVIRQVRLAFRAEGAGFSGGHDTYAVRVEGASFAVTPRSGPSVRFETWSIERGDLPFPRAAGRARTANDGSLLHSRGTVTERLKNHAEGVEQSWEFSAHPAGSGPLVVRVRASGARYLGTAPDGHLFGKKTGPKVRYGHATWVDAQGRRTEIPVRWVRGALEASVPAAVVDSSAYPAVLDPLVSPEISLDQPVYGSDATYSQLSTALAHDGTNWLVVWQDLRSGAYDIYGTRVSSGGAVLDPTGIVISPAADFQTNPAVTHDGTNWLVVWQDMRNGTYDIYGARVSGAGVVLDPLGFPISTAANGQQYPALSRGGVSSLVVWNDARNGVTDTNLYGARVDAAGTVLDPTGVPISTAAGQQDKPAVAHDGANWLVVWHDTRNGVTNYDLYGARVGGGGTVLDPSGIAVSTAANQQGDPAIAHDGTNWLVVWADTRGTNYDIYGARVSSAGTVLDPSGIAISPSANFQLRPAVAHDGTNWLVVWEENRNGPYEIRGARVNGAGTVLDASSISISPSGLLKLGPAVAHDGTNWLVTWESLSGNNFDAYGARVSGTGTVLDMASTRLSTAANSELFPAVAYGGNQWLVVWKDDRNNSTSGYDLYGVRVSEAGAVLDPNGIVLSTAVETQDTPSVAHDGTQWLVVWTDDRNSPTSASSDIYGARVDAAGTVLDPSGFPICTSPNNQLAPSVAHDGTQWLVVWADHRNSLTSGIDIYGARVDAAGTVLDPTSIAISTATNEQQAPALAFDGTQWLVVWNDLRNGSTFDIFGARVSGAGALLDAAGLAISTAADDQQNPTVAHDGTNWLVVWQDIRAGTNFDIYGARVSGAGTVLDASGIAISTGSNNEHFPAVAHDGTDWFVVWSDSRSGSNADIYGARLDAAGSVLDPMGILISAETGDEQRPRLASNPQYSLVVYSTFISPPAEGAWRVRARRVSFNVGTDGGTNDAGEADAGAFDAGSAGGGTTTSEADGGSEILPLDLRVGCGCHGTAGLGLWALALLGWWKRPRRSSLR